MTKYIIKNENKYLNKHNWTNDITKATLFGNKGGAKCAMKKWVYSEETQHYEKMDFFKNAKIVELTMEIIDSKVIDN